MLIRGGTVVTESGAGAADLRIEGERIAEVGPGLTSRDGEEVVDAGGFKLRNGAGVVVNN